MKYFILPGFAALALVMTSCQTNTTNNNNIVKLVTLDPGHFHAALVQKQDNGKIDSNVFVYAPGGAELDAYIALINKYNQRAESPTHWNETVYTGTDFLQKMVNEKKGNVVVLAGNNRQKTAYIKTAIEAGFNVLGDKPMAINFAEFERLVAVFKTAAEKNLLLYDIMTERSEITNILQKELVNMPALFGNLQTGSQTAPAIVIESVHHYYKYVSGNVLRRPTWFFDPLQQGEAIPDVGTHLVDLAQWIAFPNQALDYRQDIAIDKVRQWATPITSSQFNQITGTTSFPPFLNTFITSDTILQAHANGSVNYRLKNIHTSIVARWDYKAPEGSGDTHYALFKGTKAEVEIKQGREENYQPTVYIRATAAQPQNEFVQALQKALAEINKRYPGITGKERGTGWMLIIPPKYNIGHEAHFAQVMNRYLQYLANKKLPDWEVPNMLAKYYTATKAKQMAEQTTTTP